MNLFKTKKYYFVYKTFNLFTGKSYIGFHATDNLDDNYIGSGLYLKKAIKKHGKNNFCMGIIDFYSREEILEKEKYWINFYNTLVPNGYNLTEGGDGRLGYIPSIETRKKLSLAQKGKKASLQARQNMSNGSNRKGYDNYASWLRRFGKEEADNLMKLYKEKLSMTGKGKKHHYKPETKPTNKHNIGVPLTEEHRLNISLGGKGKKHKMTLVICPHCQKEGKGGNMTRYHFEKCKYKKDNEK